MQEETNNDVKLSEVNKNMYSDKLLRKNSPTSRKACQHCFLKTCDGENCFRKGIGVSDRDMLSGKRLKMLTSRQEIALSLTGKVRVLHRRRT